MAEAWKIDGCTKLLAHNSLGGPAVGTTNFFCQREMYSEIRGWGQLNYDYPLNAQARQKTSKGMHLCKSVHVTRPEEFSLP